MPVMFALQCYKWNSNIDDDNNNIISTYVILWIKKKTMMIINSDIGTHNLYLCDDTVDKKNSDDNSDKIRREENRTREKYRVVGTDIRAYNIM